MPLDTTPGGALADSYLSIAEADALANSRMTGYPAVWLALANEEKEKALRQATVDVDVHVNSTPRYSTTQALLFPRSTDYLGEPAVPFIHARVKEATYYQAAYLAANHELLDQAAQRRARQLFSFDEDGGPSGSIAINPLLGRFSPDAERILTDLPQTGQAGIISRRIRTIYNTVAAFDSELVG
ncbi:MAG: hypothetical protein LC798_08350 [Chloroflexi bacterium]|nr:hypothetical protein [Chloroflexota bacterium]